MRNSKTNRMSLKSILTIKALSFVAFAFMASDLL